MSLSRIGRFPIGYMIASKFTMALIGLLISGILLRPVFQRMLAGDPSLPRSITITVIASYATAALWTALHSLIDIQLVRALVEPRAQYSSVWQIFGGTLYDAFAMLSWSVLYVGIKHQRALHLERERSLRAETLAQQARLEALRWQLNPHFLFNALNAISTLVIDNRAKEATTMIARLGDLLRSSLELPATAEVTLAEEMQMVRRYLDIEQVRLGEKLKLEVIVADDAWNALVPPMLLQPLVENAVRHGIAVRREQGHLRISASRASDVLRIMIEDDGPGIAPDAEAGKGIGVANTRERLNHMYANAHGFRIDRGELGGARVGIAIPFRER